ncbi:MAG: hypothetical protein R2699_16900 [Acidimicrobiales bacterium]
MMMFLGNLNFVAIAVIGGIQVTNGAMSLGDVQAFIQYSRQFTQRSPSWRQCSTCCSRASPPRSGVFELLGAPEEVPDRWSRRRCRRRGRVAFEHIEFSYDPANPSSRTCRSWPNPARPSPSSGRPAPARRRSSTC